MYACYTYLFATLTKLSLPMAKIPSLCICCKSAVMLDKNWEEPLAPGETGLSICVETHKPLSATDNMLSSQKRCACRQNLPLYIYTLWTWNVTYLSKHSKLCFINVMLGKVSRTNPPNRCKKLLNSYQFIGIPVPDTTTEWHSSTKHAWWVGTHTGD